MSGPIVLTSEAQFAGAVDFLDRPGDEQAQRQYLAGLAAQAEEIVGHYCEASAAFARRVAAGEIA